MTRIAPHTRANARRLRNDPTPLERKFWRKLKELDRMTGTHFRRQAPVGPYIADFAEFGRRLVIEIDGGGHGGPRDKARDAWFEGEGFNVLRFWNAEVDNNIEGAMQVVLDTMEASPPPPTPPHEGEGSREEAGGLPDGKEAGR